MLATANHIAGIHIYFSSNERKYVQESFLAFQSIITKSMIKSLKIISTPIFS